MTKRVGDHVWVRRFRGIALRAVEKATIVDIRHSCVLPYRLRFHDGEENQFHETEFLTVEERERAKRQGADCGHS